MVDQSSDLSSDEDFIEESPMHMQVKTVSESTVEKKDNISSRDIQVLLGKVSQLENELWLVKNLVQDLLTRQQNKDHNDKKTYKPTRTISEKNEKNDGFSYSKQGSDQKESGEHRTGFMMYITALDLEDYDEKEEHLHHIELQSSQRKKQRKKVLKVSKGAKIRNRYNQVPHLTQDTNGKVTNSQYTPQQALKYLKKKILALHHKNY